MDAVLDQVGNIVTLVENYDGIFNFAEGYTDIQDVFYYHKTDSEFTVVLLANVTYDSEITALYVMRIGRFCI